LLLSESFPFFLFLTFRDDVHFLLITLDTPAWFWLEAGFPLAWAGRLSVPPNDVCSPFSLFFEKPIGGFFPLGFQSCLSLQILFFSQQGFAF